MGRVEAGLEPRPSELLRFVLTPGGQQPFHPGALPVVGSRSLEREGPLVQTLWVGRLGRGALLEEDERFLGATGGEQATGDRGCPCRGVRCGLHAQ